MDLLVFGDFVAEENFVDKKNDLLSKEITNVLNSVDYSIINLEAPVVDDSCLPIRKVGPNLKTSPYIIDFFINKGFSCVTLANNHFYDYGDKGVVKTIGLLEKKQLDFVGGGRTADEKNRILYKTIKKEKIAIINCCESEFSVEHSMGSKQLDTIDIYNAIQKAKLCSSFVLLIIHGGHEGYPLPSPRMQKMYRFFVDAGASIVVNHHQHCFSGYEKYNGGFIYYGLGNFFFPSQAKECEGWNEGFFLKLTIENGIVKYIKEYPYQQCCNGEFSVSLINPSGQENFKRKIHDYNHIIANAELLNKSFEEYARSKALNYRVMLSPYNNRYLRALCKRHLLPTFVSKNRMLQIYNNIHCEAHRDLFLKSFDL